MKLSKRIISCFLSFAIAVSMMCGLFVVEAGAATNAEVRNRIIEILYGGSGGYVSCDFDGYTTTAGRHEGIDCCYKKGANVYSLINGTVIRANNSTSLSTLAIYDAENDTTVIYLHSNIQVSVGTTVSRGQFVAYEDNRGASAAHTHVEMRYGKQLYASVSVNDPTLDNPNPYPYWSKVLFGDIPATNHLPISLECNIEAKFNKINISGWTFDPDDTDASLELHVYIYDAAGGLAQMAGGIWTTHESNDVNNAYGIGGTHRFNAWIDTNLSGTYSVYVFAIDTSGGNNPIIGSGDVYVTPRLNLGDDFNALILQKSYWKPITNPGDKGNIYLFAENQWDYNKMLWHFTRNPNGSYTIQSYLDNNVLDNAGGNIVASNKVMAHPYNGGINQQWSIFPHPNGAYYIKPDCTDITVLDLTNADSTNGTIIGLWEKMILSLRNLISTVFIFREIR